MSPEPEQGEKDTSSKDLGQFFDQVIRLIEKHERYSKNIHQALVDDDPLVLNYHSHGESEPFCTSICSLTTDITHPPDHPMLIELAHIKGVGSDEKSCYPLMSVFAEKLQHFYRLDYTPEIYLNGRLFIPDPGGGEA